jgi:hypothetical protein
VVLDNLSACKPPGHLALGRHSRRHPVQHTLNTGLTALAGTTPGGTRGLSGGFDHDDVGTDGSRSHRSG